MKTLLKVRLVRNFLLAFLNPAANKNHAQLVFTTHEKYWLFNEGLNMAKHLDECRKIKPGRDIQKLMSRYLIPFRKVELPYRMRNIILLKR